MTHGYHHYEQTTLVLVKQLCYLELSTPVWYGLPSIFPRPWGHLVNSGTALKARRKIKQLGAPAGWNYKWISQHCHSQRERWGSATHWNTLLVGTPLARNTPDMQTLPPQEGVEGKCQLSFTTSSFKQLVKEASLSCTLLLHTQFRSSITLLMLPTPDQEQQLFVKSTCTAQSEIADAPRYQLSLSHERKNSAGLGFGLLVLGFGLWALWFEDWDLECWVWSVEFGSRGMGCEVRS